MRLRWPAAANQTRLIGHKGEMRSIPDTLLFRDKIGLAQLLIVTRSWCLRRCFGAQRMRNLRRASSLLSPPVRCRSCANDCVLRDQNAYTLSTEFNLSI
jgi:hypothetical protein